jgi:hypothetical protein
VFIKRGYFSGRKGKGAEAKLEMKNLICKICGKRQIIADLLQNAGLLDIIRLN